MYPKSIEQISDQVITIDWDDGQRNIYFAEKVRQLCPCASCKEDGEQDKKKSPFKILDVKNPTPNYINFLSWELIGRYAIRFSFNDRHNTGIYTFEYLREIGESA